MVGEQLQGRGIRDRRVLDAMTRIPREAFMPPNVRDRAYHDAAVSIGSGQTISQPYMVAVMTQHLELRGGEKVLEVGTGSGYQAAVLADVVRDPNVGDGHIYTVERLAELNENARAILGRLGYDNVTYLLGDGTLGWSDFAPYDAIIVTAGAPQMPQPLVEQLAVGGRLVAPVGESGMQTLEKWRKTAEGEILKEQLLQCRFVPLIGEAGWDDQERV